VQGTPAALKYLQKSDFEKGLQGPPGLSASSGPEFQELIADINSISKSRISGLGKGDSHTEYDVILQPGHYLRPSGRTGTQGKYVSEQALVAFLTDKVAKKLRDSGESALVISADDYLRPTGKAGYFNGLHSKVFLAIHADGNRRPCTSGPSLAYQGQATALATNMIGLGLADAMGYNYKDFRANFTANEANYYMFGQVRSKRLTGLLEVGELTCEKSETDLIASSSQIGANVARAIDFIIRTPEAAVANSTRRHSSVTRHSAARSVM